MAQHITTLTEIRAGMEQTDTPNWGDLLYAERGTGSDRGKSFTLGEIAAKALEQSFSDDGDVDFEAVQTSAGTAYKGDIKDKHVDETKLADVIDMIQKSLRWLDTSSNRLSIDFSGIKVFASNETSFSGDGLYRFDRSGNAAVNKLIFKTTIGSQVRNGRTSNDYFSMTDCETKAGSGVKPTEYFSAVYQASIGNDTFILDSTKHEIGTIVLVTNTGEDASGVSNMPLRCFAAADTGFASPICEIPVYHSKMLRYCGLKPNTQYPVWLPVA